MPKERINDLKKKKQLRKSASDIDQKIWNKEVGIRFTQIFIQSLISIIFGSSFAFILYQRFNADPYIIGTIMSITGIVLMVYGLFIMKRIIRKIGEKRIFFSAIIGYIILFMIYPYLTELWMLYVFMVPYALCMSSVYPLISSNITKAVGPAKQGTVSGWTTNIQSISQSISPLIAAYFLQIGGLFIGANYSLAIFLNSYQLIGLINVFLSITLFLIAYIDVKKHPRLYAYEKLLRQKEAESKEGLMPESESS